MTIEDDDDLEGLRLAGRAVADAREAMLAAVEPGISTYELDRIGARVLREHGARSAPQLTYNFPAHTCVSVNAEAAHGVPSKTKILREGDLVNVDVSAELNGYFADTGASAAVGEVDERRTALLDATKQAQADAMHAAKVGNSLRSIAKAVERRARQGGFTIISDLMGHGIGRGLHEAPDVSSVVVPGLGTMLREGLVLAVEPFLSFSAERTVQGLDGWTLFTNDGSPVAQFEHTIVVTKDAPIVLTAA
jgi:methionyl aminopeptidase